VHFAIKALSEEATVRYVIDPKGSTFVVQAFSTGLLAAFGHNPKLAIRSFQGEAEFTPGSAQLKDAQLHFRIEAESLEMIDDVSDADRQEVHRRMRTEALETDRYPEITYDCSQVTGSGDGDRYWLALNGELNLHGVTRAMPVSARVLLNGNSLRASGEFTLRQSQYGIAEITAAAGAIRVKDEVKCTFDIQAHVAE
jgi:polyisoprenoid-binding protein YceI